MRTETKATRKKGSKSSPQSSQQIVTTSLELARVTGKQHSHVLKTIRAIEPDWKELGNEPLTASEYASALGVNKPCYELTKDECTYIASRFSKHARNCVLNFLGNARETEVTTTAIRKTPRDGYPTVPGFFQYVSVADLHNAMSMLIAFTKKEVYNSKSERGRELRHSANVLSTFAKTLAANSESIESHFDSLICK